ncbi:hypothetical protein PRIPAC_86809 [Pristionchus pacificus]|nr:hypothetical protein PRIPAC_86809 [Pristionchus pacificus]
MQNMGDRGEVIVLSGGGCFPLSEMDMFKTLVKKHAVLFNSADPDNKKRGVELINDEGRACSWHVQDESPRMVDELSALWKQLTEYARSINLESMDDEEDDGGMEHKVYDQIVDYFKTGKIPYEYYTMVKNANKHWPTRCSLYTLADDGHSLKKGIAYVLKKGEVMNVLMKYHRIFGHSRTLETRAFVQKVVDGTTIQQKYMNILGSCSCGYEGTEASFKDIQVHIINHMDGKRDIMFSGGSLVQLGPLVQSVKTTFSFTESVYREELMKARSSNKSKFRVADDGRTLLTLSGALVLKDDEAMDVIMRLHELCGHLTINEMEMVLPRVVFIPRKQALVKALAKKCNFCRCRNTLKAILSPSPVNVQNVKLDMKVHYDEEANERRFEITAHGVDRKVVDDYVATTIEKLKEYGKWKEPVFSPSAALARSVLRVVDLLRGQQKEEIEDVVEFDPIQNDIISMEEVRTHEKELVEECDTKSEPDSVAVSLEDGEMSGEEEEKMDDEEGEEGQWDDVEDEELTKMRRQIEENDRRSEAMENETSRLADATGRMRAYIRQWEFSEYLREQIRLNENPQERRIEEDNLDEVEKSGESEEEEVKEEEEEERDEEEDKENAVAHEAAAGASAVGLSKEEKTRLANKKKRAGKKKRKEILERPPYDLTPYRANYEEKNESRPDVANTMQMEKVEREKSQPPPSPFPSLARAIQRGREDDWHS